MQGWCPVKTNLFPSTFLQCVQSANPLVIPLLSSISLCCDIRLLWPLKEGNNSNPLYWEIDPDCCRHFDRVMLLPLTRCDRKVNLWLSHQRISTLSFLRRQSKLNYYLGKCKWNSIVFVCVSITKIPVKNIIFATQLWWFLYFFHSSPILKQNILSFSTRLLDFDCLNSILVLAMILDRSSRIHQPFRANLAVTVR